MKKFLILFVVCLPLIANAQNNEMSTDKANVAERPEGIIVHNTNHERHVLGLKEYSYGMTDMDKKAYAEFLKNNCPQAFAKYYKGQQMITSGWSLFGLGLATTVIGIPVVWTENLLYVSFANKEPDPEIRRQKNVRGVQSERRHLPNSNSPISET